MSTRALTYIHRGRPGPVATNGAYRHCDGYIAENGRDLLALSEAMQGRVYGSESMLESVVRSIYILRGTNDPTPSQNPLLVEAFNGGHGDTEYEYWLELPESGHRFPDSPEGTIDTFRVWWRERTGWEDDKSVWSAWSPLEWDDVYRADEKIIRNIKSRVKDFDPNDGVWLKPKAREVIYP